MLCPATGGDWQVRDTPGEGGAPVPDGIGEALEGVGDGKFGDVVGLIEEFAWIEGAGVLFDGAAVHEEAKGPRRPMASSHGFMRLRTPPRPVELRLVPEEAGQLLPRDRFGGIENGKG